MTQPTNPQGAPTPGPARVSLAAIIFAVAVVALLVGLLVMLTTNRPSSVATGADVTPIAAQPAGTAAAAAPTVETAPKKTYSERPPLTVDPTKNYTATITTPRGDIVIKLRPDLALETVNSFVFLAREGFYDGLTWHRVIPGFVAQGGDPLGDGTGGPGYTVPAEFTDQVLFDRKGLVAMARTPQDPNSGGSQFFITLGPTENLNNQYTIFGEVVEGQDIVDGIPAREPVPGAPAGEQMLKVTISEN